MLYLPQQFLFEVLPRPSKEVVEMVDRYYLAPNEAVLVDTTQNTITVVYPYGSGNVEVRDSANNVLSTMQLWDMYTLPANTGQYNIVYTGTTEAVVLVFRRFIA